MEAEAAQLRRNLETRADATKEWETPGKNRMYLDIQKVQGASAVKYLVWN